MAADNSLFNFGTTAVNFNPGGGGVSAKDTTVGGIGAGGNGGQYTAGLPPANSGTGGGNLPPGGSPYPLSTDPGSIFGTGGTGTSTGTSALPFYTGDIGQVSGNLSQAFGPLGPYLLSAIQTGGYNPQVFNDLIAQLQPQILQSEATIGANTGASGTRFGSGYDLALGDFLSQVNLNEQGLAGNLYQNAVQNSFGLLGGALNPLSQFASNQGGFTSSLITSLIGALGPTLLGKIPGLGGGNNNNNYPQTPQTLPPIDFPAPTYPTDPSSGPTAYTPTTAGSPNSTDPFGNTGGGSPFYTP